MLSLSALIAVFLLADSSVAYAQAASSSPDLSITLGGKEMMADGSVSSVMKIIAVMSLISFAPALILTGTCFTRIAVVLGMTRTALGTQALPPNMVITGLSLFLSAVIMGPVFTEMYEKGMKPYMDGKMSQEEAFKQTAAPLQKFLVRHAREKDLAMFLEITNTPIPETPETVPLYVALPSFVLSELNAAFQIGFLIALPFLVLDMVVSSVLTSMSMITLPPVVISMPLKLMLFVLVDGWHLIIGSLINTYHVG